MVKHVLADGREVESVEGILVPPSGPTASVYRIIAEFAKNHPEITRKEKEQNSNAHTTAKRSALKRG